MENKNFFMVENENLKGYDIKKRNSIETEDGFKDETVLTIYSVEYLDNVLDALNSTDNEAEG